MNLTEFVLDALDADEAAARYVGMGSYVAALRRVVELHYVIRAAYPNATIESDPCCNECSAGGEYPDGYPCETFAPSRRSGPTGLGGRRRGGERGCGVRMVRDTPCRHGVRARRPGSVRHHERAALFRVHPA